MRRSGHSLDYLRISEAGSWCRISYSCPGSSAAQVNRLVSGERPHPGGRLREAIEEHQPSLRRGTELSGWCQSLPKPLTLPASVNKE